MHVRQRMQARCYSKVRLKSGAREGVPTTLQSSNVLVTPLRSPSADVDSDWSKQQVL